LKSPMQRQEQVPLSISMWKAHAPHTRTPSLTLTHTIILVYFSKLTTNEFPVPGQIARILKVFISFNTTLSFSFA
jgi:hypothetical protein